MVTICTHLYDRTQYSPEHSSVTFECDVGGKGPSSEYGLLLPQCKGSLSYSKHLTNMTDKLFPLRRICRSSVMRRCVAVVFGLAYL